MPAATADAIQKPSLKGMSKAAALLVALGPEASATVLKSMKDHEIESLTMSLAQTKPTDEEIETVVHEGYGLALASDAVSSGGADYARQVLNLALGADKADVMLNRVTAAQPFEFLRKTDPKQIALVLESEHPQTTALILAHLPPNQTAAVLPNLSEDLQVDVARRVATMDRIPPEIVHQVAEVLRHRISSMAQQGSLRVGGFEHLAAVLTTVDRGTERRILERLVEEDPTIADQVRMMMFTFDDIISLDGRSLQRVLRDIDTRDLALALKAAGDDLKEHFFSNMSSRAAEMLREEIALSGPVKIRNVEEAQQRIVAVVRRLEDEEEIVISRDSEEVLA